MSGHGGMGWGEMWYKASRDLSQLLRYPHRHPRWEYLVNLATGDIQIEDCVWLLKMERQELLGMIKTSVRLHGDHPDARFELSSDETRVRAAWRPWQEVPYRLSKKEVPSLT